MKSIRLLLHPDAASASSGGQTGDFATATADATANLLSMMTQANPADSPETSGEPTDGAEAAPEAGAVPPDAPDPGQDISPADSPEADAEGETTDLSQSPDNNALPAELAGLPPGERKKLFAQLAEQIKNGESPNGLMRGHKYAQRLERQLEELNAKVEQMQQGGGTTAEPQQLPPNVAKLKTEAEVKQWQGRLEDIVDFCTDHPQGGEFNGQTYDGEQVMQLKRQARTELRALPDRTAQLTQQAQFATARESARAQIHKDFPVLNDVEHPDTQMVRQMVRDPRFANELNAEYVALALVRGHKALQAERQARVKPAAKPAAGTPARGKPAGAPSAAAPRATGRPDGKALLSRVMKEGGSQNELAALIAAAG